MTKPKILLVDDVNLLLELEKNFLKFSPVRILTARSGVEALSVIDAERPDLVFMDLNMPGMDGAACCRKIKENPSTAIIPVVMVTTAGRPEDEELCRQAGCDDYLYKPIDRRIFLDMGRKYLPFIDRREPRIPCSGEVALNVAGQTFAGRMVDLSVGGIYISTMGSLRQDDLISLSFTINGKEPRAITTDGRVAWENPGNAQNKLRLPAGFGIEFVGMDERIRILLHEYVEELKP